MVPGISNYHFLGLGKEGDIASPWWSQEVLLGGCRQEGGCSKHRRKPRGGGVECNWFCCGAEGEKSTKDATDADWSSENPNMPVSCKMHLYSVVCKVLRKEIATGWKVRSVRGNPGYPIRRESL